MSGDTGTRRGYPVPAYQPRTGLWVTPLDKAMGIVIEGVSDVSDLRDGDLCCLPGDGPRVVDGTLVTDHRPTVWHNGMNLDGLGGWPARWTVWR